MNAGPLSGAALPDTSHEPLASVRYEVGGVLGRGGLGEVRSAHDAHLGRVVAMKIAREPEEDGRLLEEARRTAALSHPHIVPIFDIGELEGRPFYTMPLLEGATLESRMEGTLAERLAAVEHVLNAAEAAAHAHRRGVVHRDIKPANIVIGALEETLLADWGIARRIDETSLAAGTIGYSTPEQLEDGTIRPSDDLHALGGVLFALLTGRHPSPGVRVLQVVRHAPPELAAIADRARRLHDHPYDSTEAFIADLRAWSTGRRVDAHTYSLVEIFRRWISRHRAAVSATAVGVTALALASVVSVQQIRQQRDQAIHARDEASQNLHAARVSQALLAAERNDRARAEQHAVLALQHGESIDARGVLARFGSRDRPRLVGEWPLERCDPLALSPTGELGCGHPGGLTRGSPDALRKVSDLRAREVGFTGDVLYASTDSERLWSFQPDDTARSYSVSLTATLPRGQADPERVLLFRSGSLLWLDPTTGDTDVPPRCPSGPPLDAVPTAASLVLLCPSSVRHVGSDGSVFDVALPGTRGIQDDLYVFERRALITTVDGAVQVVDLDDRSVQTWSLNEAEITSIDLHGQRLVTAAEREDVQIWRAGRREFRIPVRGRAVRWLDEGTLRVVHDTGVVDWHIPRRSLPLVHTFESGISSMSVDSRGRLATGHGDGHVRITDLETGLTESHFLHDSVVKDVAFGDDDRLAAVAAQDLGVHVIAGSDHEKIMSERPYRRVGWRDGQLVMAPYGLGIDTLVAGGVQLLEHTEEQVVGIETLGEDWVVHGRDGRIWVPGREEAIATNVPPRGIAVDGDEIFWGRPRGFTAYRDGDVRTATVDAAPVVSIAVQGEHVVIGHLDGLITVFDRRTLRARGRLVGHRGRVAALTFLDTGELLSGGWDGEVRRWHLDSLTRPLAQLASDVEGWTLPNLHSISTRSLFAR